MRAPRYNGHSRGLRRAVGAGGGQKNAEHMEAVVAKGVISGILAGAAVAAIGGAALSFLTPLPDGARAPGAGSEAPTETSPEALEVVPGADSRPTPEAAGDAATGPSPETGPGTDEAAAAGSVASRPADAAGAVPAAATDPDDTAATDPDDTAAAPRPAIADPAGDVESPAATGIADTRPPASPPTGATAPATPADAPEADAEPQIARSDRGAPAAPGLREAAPPPTPERDAALPAQEPPAPAEAPAPAEGVATAEVETNGAAVEPAPTATDPETTGAGRRASAADAPADTAPADTGAGAVPPAAAALSVPAPDEAPGARVSTAPSPVPEAADTARVAPRPEADAGPAAPVPAAPADSLRLSDAGAPPVAPGSERPPEAPALPGREVTTTPAIPGDTPVIDDTGPVPPAAQPLPEGPVLAEAPRAARLAQPSGAADTALGGDTAPPVAPETSVAAPASPGTAGEGEAGDARADTSGTDASDAAPAPPAGGGDSTLAAIAPAVPAQPAGQSPAPVVEGPAAPPPPTFEDSALPRPGFGGGVAGVRTGRLPVIGGEAAADATGAAPSAADASDVADPAVEADVAAGDGTVAAVAPLPPLERNAEPFENPEGRPLVAVVIEDIGEDGIGSDRLAALDLPVTIALDPTVPGVSERAEAYRAAGKEVVMLATGLPRGATASDVAVSFESHFRALPQSLAVVDLAIGGFQNDRIRAQQVVGLLADAGYGLLTHDRGLNAAAQIAERDGVSGARIFRLLDGEAEDELTVRRYLDRAAFRAAQTGQVTVYGQSRPETMAALLGWAMEGRGATVTLAPLSAVLGGG